MFLLTLFFVVVLITFIYRKGLIPFQYWEKKGIPYVKPWPFLGNMAPTIFRTNSYPGLLQDVYHQFEGQRYFGFYQFSLPSLMITDPELIKKICIKDFDKFTDRPDFLPPDSDPFWKRNLGSKQGEDWYDMRVILSPAFTGRKMKMMFQLMCDCCEKFVNHFQKEVQNEVVCIDMKDAFTRLGNDIIASTSFGVTCDSLGDKNNEFYLMGKEHFDFTGIKSLKFFGLSISEKLMRLLRVTFIDKRMQEFVCNIVHESIEYREKTGVIRPDMIHLLREAQKGRLMKEEDDDFVDSSFASVDESDISKGRIIKKREITEEDIAAQGVVFFLAGFDTVATLLFFIAYELAINPDIQEKLIKEVDVTLNKCDGKITYESLLGMKYLDMVVSETLRLWPPAAVLARKSVKPYTIDPINPGEKSVEIEIGTDILVPVYALHRDPKYYTNPNKFDPERFNDENKRSINPFVYLPFGSGPRNCIGNRFALMETKVVLFYLLTKFKLSAVSETPIPLTLSRNTAVLIGSNGGYRLGMRARY